MFSDFPRVVYHSLNFLQFCRQECLATLYSGLRRGVVASLGHCTRMPTYLGSDFSHTNDVLFVGYARAEGFADGPF